MKKHKKPEYNLCLKPLQPELATRVLETAKLLVILPKHPIYWFTCKKYCWNSSHLITLLVNGSFFNWTEFVSSWLRNVSADKVWLAFGVGKITSQIQIASTQLWITSQSKAPQMLWDVLVKIAPKHVVWTLFELSQLLCKPSLTITTPLKA